MFLFTHSFGEELSYQYSFLIQYCFVFHLPADFINFVGWITWFNVTNQVRQNREAISCHLSIWKHICLITKVTAFHSESSRKLQDLKHVDLINLQEIRLNLVTVSRQTRADLKYLLFSRPLIIGCNVGVLNGR